MHLIHLDVTFPEGYPNQPPQFSFNYHTTINQEKGYTIIKRLKNLAQSYAVRGVTCLEPILQAYEQEVIEIINEEKKEAYCAKKCAKYYRDSNVPYPRISGARFCGRGQLVCFGWTFRVMGEGLVGGGTLPKAAIKTPRALSAISGNAAAVGSSRPNSVPALIKVSDLKKSTKVLASPVKPKMVRIANTPSTPIKPSSNRRGNSTTENESEVVHNGGRILPLPTKSSVTIYDVNSLLNFHIDLAKKYKTNGNIEDLCLYNAKLCFELNFPHYGKTWTTCAKICNMRPQEDKTIIKNYMEKMQQKHCELQYFPTECSCPTKSKKSLCFFGYQQTDHNTTSNHFLARIMLKKIISHYMKLRVNIFLKNRNYSRAITEFFEKFFQVFY